MPAVTKANAKIGQTFQDQVGHTYLRVQSPYSKDATIDVMQNVQPGGSTDTNLPAPADQMSEAGKLPPIPDAPTVEPVPAGQTVAAAPTATAAPLASEIAKPTQAIQSVTPAADVENSLEPEHLLNLGQRQVAADANQQMEDDFHASLDQPQPAAPPPVVPTIAQQPQRPLQASMLPTGALGDYARGIVETPDMIGSGAKLAVHNLIAYSDHLSGLIQEHIPVAQPYIEAAINPVNSMEDMARTVSGGASAPTFDAVANHTPFGATDMQPKSRTGSVVKGISQAATSYAIGGEALGAWKAASAAGKLVKSFAAGALGDFAGFDAHQARLSDMIRGHAPAAMEPIFDYLASDPRDSESEGRLKNALEGLGIGATLHEVMAGARYLRNVRVVRRAAAIAAHNEGLQGIVDAEHPAVVSEAQKFAGELQETLGNVGGKGFTIRRKFPLTPGEIAGVADSGEMGPNTIGLNYAKIADTADLQAASVQFYDAFHGEITDAKRGVQSIDKQVKDAFGTEVSALLANWQPGTAMLSHEIIALRFAQAGAMADTVRLARQIAGGDTSLATQAAFLQVGGITDALSRAVEGGKAEAARTLRTLRETVPSMVGEQHTAANVIEFYRKVDALIAGGGGKDMVERAAKAFLVTAQANPLGASKMLRGFKWLGKFNDKSKEVLTVFMTNGLLTVRGLTDNILGNTSALVWERMMRQLAPKLSNLVGSEAYIHEHEAVASQTAALSAFGDVFRLADHINAGWNPIAHGRVLAANFDAAKDATKGFTRAHREEVIAAAGRQSGGIGQTGLERGPGSDTALGRVASFLYGAIKKPGEAHGVLDDFSNIISGRAELASQAYRQAQKDVDNGLITADQVGAKMHAYMEDPDANMLERVIAAQQNTSWTRKPDTSFGKVTTAVSNLRTGLNSLPIPLPIGTRIFPFINTPANLFSYGVQNSIFAPLSSRFRAAVMSEDGATRELALTKYAAGSLMSLWIMNHVANGTMTGAGSKDPAQREAMTRVDPVSHEAIFQPYSVRMGDNWVDMSRMVQPFANNFMLAADMSEAWLGNDWTDGRVHTATDAFSAAAMSFGNAFMERSTMQGASQLMNALAESKRGQYGAADQFVQQTLPMADPVAGYLNAARHAVDPYQRQARGVVDAFKNTVPGLSSDLPLSFDLWGRKRTYDTGMGTAYDQAFSTRVRPIGGEPIDREMLHLGFGKTMPSKIIDTPAGPADLRDEPFIANEILTRGGPAALQELNDTVSGNNANSDYYNSLSDGSDPHAPGSKARYIQGRLDFYFAQAKDSIKRDFGDDLTSIATEQAGRRAAARSGGQ